MAEPWLTTDEQRCWRAIVTIVNTALPQLERTLRREGIMLVQYGILVALSESTTQTVRLGELATYTNLSPSRLSQRIRPLIDNGDVSVRTCTTDRRGTEAVITDQGLRRLARIAPVHAADVRSLLLAPLDGDEITRLADLLTTITNDLTTA